MASGLPEPRWNNADVDDASLFDVAAAASWYAAVANGAGVPWGARVPAGRRFDHGRLLFRKRLAAVLPGALRPPAPVPGLVLEEVRAGDVGRMGEVDAAVFDLDVELSRAWIGPQLASARHHVVLATLDGGPAGLGVGARSFDRAGPTLGLSGIGVLDHARGRGVEAALVTELAVRGLSAGARLVHTTLGDDEDAERHAALGFTEVEGLDVYVVVERAGS